MKKRYEVIGAFMGLAKGSILEADSGSVENSGILGTKLKELPTASAPETPVGDASDAPKGNGGPTPNPSPTASATPAPPPKPPVVTPKPAVVAPKPLQPAGVVAKSVVTPVAAKPAVAPK